MPLLPILTLIILGMIDMGNPCCVPSANLKQLFRNRVSVARTDHSSSR